MRQHGSGRRDVDLRPYAAKLKWEVGIGTKHVQDASYPFLIQEKYRAGYFTHYAGEGTVRSAKLTYEGEEVDLCLCRTKAHFSEEEPEGGKKKRILTLDPVDIEFHDLTLKLQTRVIFTEGSSDIQIERNILEMSNPEAKVELERVHGGMLWHNGISGGYDRHYACVHWRPTVRSRSVMNTSAERKQWRGLTV